MDAVRFWEAPGKHRRSPGRNWRQETPRKQNEPRFIRSRASI